MALLAQLPEDLRLGREYALLGNYDTALIYLGGVCDSLKQQIDKSSGPQKEQLQEVQSPAAAHAQARQSIIEELTVVRDISNELGLFKVEEKPAREESKYASLFSHPRPCPRRAERSRHVGAPATACKVYCVRSAHVQACCQLASSGTLRERYIQARRHSSRQRLPHPEPRPRHRERPPAARLRRPKVRRAEVFTSLIASPGLGCEGRAHSHARHPGRRGAAQGRREGRQGRRGRPEEGATRRVPLSVGCTGRGPS